jgi:hypothetical protein
MPYFRQIRDDQLRYNANFPQDIGGLADVVPYDGIGGNPAFGVRDNGVGNILKGGGHGACPVWQVAYIVIARQMWKHYGEVGLDAHCSSWTMLHSIASS